MYVIDWKILLIIGLACWCVLLLIEALIWKGKYKKEKNKFEGVDSSRLAWIKKCESLQTQLNSFGESDWINLEDETRIRFSWGGKKILCRLVEAKQETSSNGYLTGSYYSFYFNNNL